MHGFVAKSCVAVAISFPAAACAAPHKVMDLRTMTDPAGEFSVSLCTRPSPTGNVPGHAFVVYAHKPPTGNRKVLAIGFTTTSGAAKAALSYNGWLSVADGHLGEERFTHMNENCLVTLVDKKVFDNAWAIAHPFASVPGLATLVWTADYRLAENDCMTFMINVAKTLPSVKVPARGATELPRPYLRRLIEAN